MSLIRFLVVVGAICSASAVHAQAASTDNCSNVLSSGTLKKTDWKSRDFLKMLVSRRFVRQTAADVSKDQDFGGQAYDSLFSGYYTEQNHESLRESVQASLDYSRFENHELDVALASGDPEILKAWSDCMDSRKVLKLRFTNIAARVATLEVTWTGGAPAEEASVDSVHVISTNEAGEPALATLRPNDCLSPGVSLLPKRTCTVPFILASAASDLLVTVNSKQFAAPATAYLPQRMKWVISTRTLLSTERGAAPQPYSDSAANRGNLAYGSEVCFNPSAFNGGRPVLLQVFNAVRDQCYGTGNCNSVKSQLSTTAACFTSGAQAESGDVSCGCRASAKLHLIHAAWVPIDTPVSPTVDSATVKRWENKLQNKRGRVLDR